MTHVHTFDARTGCPFKASALFPGCAHWPICVCAAPIRGSWVTDSHDPELDLEQWPLVACDEFLEAKP